MKRSAGLYIGTTGWNYDSWKKIFYPEKMAKSGYLEHYAASFPTVELSTTFYQLPPAKVLLELAGAVPDSFRFAVKGNRYITHIKKLNEGRTILPPFFARMDPLGDKMGPVLLQMPPNWSFNRDRLKSFVAAMPQDRRFVFEFHHPSWYNDTTYELLSGKNAALGIFQLGEKITPMLTTADFVYMRIVKPRGRNGERVPGLMETWMDSIQGWLGSGRDVYCYFYQGESDCAVTDALQFRAAVENALGAGLKKARRAGVPRMDKKDLPAAAARIKAPDGYEKGVVNWS